MGGNRKRMTIELEVAVYSSRDPCYWFCTGLMGNRVDPFVD